MDKTYDGQRDDKGCRYRGHIQDASAVERGYFHEHEDLPVILRALGHQLVSRTFADGSTATLAINSMETLVPKVVLTLVLHDGKWKVTG